MTSQATPDAGDASDEVQVSLAARGDTLAFGRLASKYRAKLRAIAFRVLRNQADADDVVQEVFARAWVRAPDWCSRNTSAASYAAWLARIAVNAAIDQRRKVRMVPLDDAVEPEDPALNPEARMVSAERAQRVQAAIDALPERQLLALSLSYDADLSNAEGAAAMNVSVGAFELLLVRARRALRLSLREV